MGTAVEVTRGDMSPADLRAVSAKCTDGAQVRRILAVALALGGRPRTEAAALNGMDRQTLWDWVHRYNSDGVERLKSRKSPRRDPFLTEAQKAELRELVIPPNLRVTPADKLPARRATAWCLPPPLRSPLVSISFHRMPAS